MRAAPIMIMAGGSGGHIFPGLAVAEVLRERQHAVVWLGTRRGLEATLVPEHDIDIEWITITGVRRSGLVAWLAAPFKIGLATVQALSVMRRRRPAAVLGVGGFVSGPGGLAAWLARKPLVIHEQNAVAGTANRLLARFADKIFEAFPGSFASRHRAIAIGNPIRRAIVAAAANAAPAADGISGRRPRLLVIGGSQGALALNQGVPAALALLPAAERPEIRHQAGRTLAQAEAAYAAAGVAADTVDFIADMAEAYQWADLVIARAGAISLAEIAMIGRGSILVPLPTAVDDHQRKNAEHFAGAGAAIVIPQSELEPRRLAHEIQRVFSDAATAADMGRRARTLARPDAAEQLADACLALAGAKP